MRAVLTGCQDTSIVLELVDWTVMLGGYSIRTGRKKMSKQKLLLEQRITDMEGTKTLSTSVKTTLTLPEASLEETFYWHRCIDQLCF